MALPSQFTACYQDLHSMLEDGKVDWTRGTKMPLRVIHIFKHLDIAVSKHQIHHDNYQSVFNQHSYTQVLRLCIALALNTAWQWSGRFFIHISGYTYNFIYNELRVSWTWAWGTEMLLQVIYIALSKHLIHQNCHQGAQNQHKQLPSHSYISTPQCCITPVSYYTMTDTRMFFTGSLATFFVV